MNAISLPLGLYFEQGRISEPYNLKRIYMSTSSRQLTFVLSTKTALQNIRNYLAGRLVGATRDRVLMDEVFKCVFAKHWLITHSSLMQQSSVATSYQTAFECIKNHLPGIFETSDVIALDASAIEFVDAQLDAIELDSQRTTIFDDLYETFGGTGIKSSEGQFFTPKSAINFILDLVQPAMGQTICDPACGAGGFLMAATERLLAMGNEAKHIAQNLSGIDKDDYLTRLARGRLSLLLDEMPNIVCADSLSGEMLDGNTLPERRFDVILTNPPFGSKIVAAGAQTLNQYQLARRWIKPKRGDERYHANGTVNASTPPQVLFIEQCMNLLKPDGVLGAILPESLISTPSYEYVVQYIHDMADVIAVVGMPESLFKTSGKGGTHTKTVAIALRKKPVSQATSTVFFAEAKWCGNDSRGREIPLNDLPDIAFNFQEHQAGKPVKHGLKGMAVPISKISLNLAPRAFAFDLNSEVDALQQTHHIITIAELVERGALSIATGDEIGKLAYGTGEIPFVRTSDISNWEIKLDPKHCVAEAVYERFQARQDIRAGDILMVKDGTYLIGTCAMVTTHDLPMLYQSHLYKIRVEDSTQINPYLFLAALSSDFVKRQIKGAVVSQDIIDTLGNKIHQLRIAFPKDPAKHTAIAAMVERVIHERIEARELARQACDEIMQG
jgi:type I restriction enzyme M protein